MANLKAGDVAPDFTLPSSDGRTLSMHDLVGQDVVLYFYPKDDTSGCTKEACSFRDNLGALGSLGATVLGVSPDSVESHDRFAAKYGLNFPLLADVDHRLAEEYGVWQEKTNYGRKYMGINRSTFLIGPDGRIKRVWHNVKPEGHADQVLEALNDRQ